MIRALSISLALVLLVVVDLASQTARLPAHAGVQPGSRVRLNLEEERRPRVGQVLAVSSETLHLLQRGDTLAFPATLVRQLEVSSGRDRAKGWLRGAGIGGHVSAIGLGGLFVALDEPG
jgi:hypothetical protein